MEFTQSLCFHLKFLYKSNQPQRIVLSYLFACLYVRLFVRPSVCVLTKNLYVRVKFKIFFSKHAFTYKTSAVENEWHNKHVIICFARSLKDLISSFVPTFTVCGRVDKSLVCFIKDTVGHVVTDILLLVTSSTKKQLPKKNMINKVKYYMLCKSNFNVTDIWSHLNAFISQDFNYLMIICHSIGIFNICWNYHSILNQYTCNFHQR